ncbi:MAG: 50S ribosomal protein L24 [Candidatus Bathyarchaeia archaeon]
MQVAVKPSKQRKRLFQAPDHMRYKHFAAPLSPELRKTHGTRCLPVRRGDTVRVMRGDHKGFEGKVFRVDRKKYRIYIEGLTREKVDGTTVLIPIHPSKVMITKLNLEDKWRREILERRKRGKEVAEVAEKVVEKIEKPLEVAAAVEKTAAEEKVEKPKRGKRAAKKTVKEKEEVKTKAKTETKAKTRKRKLSEEQKLG